MDPTDLSRIRAILSDWQTPLQMWQRVLDVAALLVTSPGLREAADVASGERLFYRSPAGPGPRTFTEYTAVVGRMAAQHGIIMTMLLNPGRAWTIAQLPAQISRGSLHPFALDALTDLCAAKVIQQVTIGAEKRWALDNTSDRDLMDHVERAVGQRLRFLIGRASSLGDLPKSELPELTTGATHCATPSPSRSRS